MHNNEPQHIHPGANTLTGTAKENRETLKASIDDWDGDSRMMLVYQRTFFEQLGDDEFSDTPETETIIITTPETDKYLREVIRLITHMDWSVRERLFEGLSKWPQMEKYIKRYEGDGQEALEKAKIQIQDIQHMLSQERSSNRMKDYRIKDLEHELADSAPHTQLCDDQAEISRLQMRINELELLVAEQRGMIKGYEEMSERDLRARLEFHQQTYIPPMDKIIQDFQNNESDDSK